MKDWTEELKLFDERLSSYSTEELLEKLEPWEKVASPTVEEFIAEMVTDREADKLIGDNISSLYEE